MAVFNFEIKRQSYNIALKQTKEALSAGDIEGGKAYLAHAIDLCSQLVQNCTVEMMRAQYASENKKLMGLQASLNKGINPFAAQRAAQPSPSAGNQPGGGMARQDAGSVKAQPGEKPKSQFFMDEVPKTTLADVAGLDDVKKEIRLRVLAPMKDKAFYAKYMDDVGCQILMYGPPGCGKSFVAEAVAGELGCAYAVINAADLLDKYVGEGSKKVVQIFKEAEAYDNCLIFFDELDSIFSSREGEDSRHTKDILTTFLTCLSGFHADNGGLKVIIGATNRPWALDSAVVRGKRFDTHIYVGLPDAEARRFLVNKAFKKNPSLLENTDIKMNDFVEMYDGYSCADISSMLSKVKTKAFERALDKREMGEMSDEPVTMADAKTVLSDYRNSVTKESLEAFEAFRRGEI